MSTIKTLYESEGTKTGPITLNDTMINYDVLVMYSKHDNFPTQLHSSFHLVDQFTNHKDMTTTELNGLTELSFKYKTDTSLDLISASSVSLFKIVGIKF